MTIKIHKNYLKIPILQKLLILMLLSHSIWSASVSTLEDDKIKSSGRVVSPLAEPTYQQAVDLEKAGKIDKALKYYEEAAGLGYPRAQYNLACHYHEGKVVPKNIDKALGLFTLAAEGGHARAQFNLASMYEKGKIVAKDEGQARFWYQKAASGGFARAASQLGILLEEGRGGETDDVQAVVYYRQAAAEKEPSALHNLGRLSMAGKGGLPKSEEEAGRYFAASAELDFAPAQLSLGLLFEHQEKYAEAKTWYYKAAKNHYDKSYYFLATLYEDGLGAEQNTRKAHDLYKLAAAVSDGSNYTPLQLAAKEGRLEAVKTMVVAGADIEAGNRDGMTALRLAIKYRHQPIVDYLQVIYEANNLMGRKLQKKFEEQEAAIAALRSAIDSTASAHGSSLEALKGKVDKGAAATDDIRGKLSVLTEQHEKEQQEERERLYIKSQENLSTFYRQFQRKLEELFLAYKVLNTGMVTREKKDTTNKVANGLKAVGETAEVVGDLLELAGDLVPIPFVNTIVKVSGFFARKAIGKGVGLIGTVIESRHEAKVEAQAAFISGLVENVTIMAREIEKAARKLTSMYEPQLVKIRVDGSKLLAECGVRRFLEYMKAGKANDKDNLSEQIMDAIMTFEAKQGVPPFTNKPIPMLASVGLEWTDEGIYQRTGIQTKDGRKYTNALTKVDKYGYRLADAALAAKLGFY